MSNLYAVTFFYKYSNKLGKPQTRSDTEYYEASSENEILSFFNSVSNATITKISKVHYNLSLSYNLDFVPIEPSIKKYKYSCLVIKENKQTIFYYYNEKLIDDKQDLLVKIKLIDTKITDLIEFTVT